MVKAMRRACRALAVLALAAGAASCREVTTSEEQATIIQVLNESSAHGTFLGGLTATGLSETLGSDGPYTVFAPTDAAFDALPAATRQAIAADPAKRAAVLRNHIVGSRALASTLTSGRQLTTLAGNQVTISRTGNTIRYGNATVVLDNLGASNGVIHVIDQVVLPPGI